MPSGSPRSSTRSPSSRRSTACGSSSTGTPATAFGGEGVTCSTAGRPIVRKDFRDQLPAIFIDRPGLGRGARQPGANVSGARQRVRGDVPGRACATRSGADPRRPAGDGHLRDRLLGHLQGRRSAYTVAKAQWGTLRVYDLSAKDGSPENVTEYPVWLTPGELTRGV